MIRSVSKPSRIFSGDSVGSLQNAQSIHKCQLIEKVKSLFEAILTFLRRIFCCRTREIKSPAIAQQSASSKKIEAIPQKVLSKDPPPAVSSVPNTPSQDNKKKELLLPTFPKKPLPKPVEIVLSILEERPLSPKASDTNTKPRATPTIFSKIGDAVVEHHLLPFFDRESCFEILKCYHL
jgi:hypothetical protein